MGRSFWNSVRLFLLWAFGNSLTLIVVFWTNPSSSAPPIEASDGWSSWWTYHSFSGPELWGLVNPDWSLCYKGKRQSPVAIDPARLVHDPGLRTLRIDKHRVHGYLRNTGQILRFDVDNTTESFVNLTGGPLSYRYRFTSMAIHFGSTGKHGSEHQIGGNFFPAEIQLIAYNSDLYPNETTASRSPNGLAVVAILAQVGNRPNEEFTIMMQRLPDVKYKDQAVHVKYVSFRSLVPPTVHFMTYEGSLTFPPCHETVTWMVMNKPLYITERQLSVLRQMRQGTVEQPHTSLEDNFRPTQALHHRSVRTNLALGPPNPAEIDFQEMMEEPRTKSSCQSTKANFFYQANTMWNT